MNEKFCDERHEKIDESLKLINSKLDIVIRNDEFIRNLWKFASIFLVMVALAISAFKLIVS